MINDTRLDFKNSVYIITIQYLNDTYNCNIKF